jgi:hypothetical protein
VKQLLVGVALVATACGGATSTESLSASTTPGDAPAPAATDAPAATAAPAPAGESSGSADSVEGRQRPEGPDAPDFSLPLGQGYDFVLSAEAKPVYMVFWAEW